MIDMGVGEENRVDPGRIEGEGLMIERFERARALEHAAIDEQPPSAMLDLEAGSGHGLRRAVDGDQRLAHDSVSVSPSPVRTISMSISN